MTKDRSSADPSGIDRSRRQMLKAATAIAAVTLAPGWQLIAAAEAKAPGEAVTDKNRWGILVDTTKMDKATCDVAVDACNREHGLTKSDHPGQDPQWIRRLDIRDPQTGAAHSLPMMCQHCQYPPCADVCPTGASFRRIDGIVLVDKHICIGCRYCMLACPYKARSFAYRDIEDPKPHSPRGRGTVQSCTMCVHRVDVGGIPACVEACNEVVPGSMIFGDLKDPESEIAKRVSVVVVKRVRADLGTDPGVLYLGV